MPSVQALGGVRGGPAGLVLFGGAAFFLPAAAAFVARGYAFRRRASQFSAGTSSRLRLLERTRSATHRAPPSRQTTIVTFVSIPT